MRAAPYGNLQVLAPMVTSPDEVAQTMGIFAEEAEDLAMQGIAHGTPPLGIMLEVPAAALMPHAAAAQLLKGVAAAASRCGANGDHAQARH